ncbi:kinase-like domain-containing protein [Achaetomium macrosporum]|uniref:Kinase-like domain-containing protein n=1 Tax=Achaetomium macrosporum TaxID=79813 RepID=A0AAN7C3R1_9PEZI|nr:kinase-like domain-containing protein [Achaetomium macrosporum]
MTFDFESYLSTLYPSTTYHVTPLSGGLVNFTVRARRVDGDDASVPDSASTTSHPKESAPVPPQTLILKHAPPYIATLGAVAPFSQARQTVEATVLKLFHPTTGPLAHLNNHPEYGNILIPHIISHDPAQSILALQDLGDELLTLWEFFTPTTTAAASSLRSHASRAAAPATKPNAAATIGARLGTFFASLHSASTLAAIQGQGPNDIEAVRVLDKSLTRQVVRDAAVAPILARLQDPGGLDAAAAERLYARAVADYERGPIHGPGQLEECCLSMGDFHPGSVLGKQKGDVAAPVVGVIDWEFATTENGRGVNGDMAQFLASMHVLMLSLAREGEIGAVREAVELFLRELCSAYAKRSDLARRVKDAVAARRIKADEPALRIFRSTLILFGRETINQAVERTWEHVPAVSVEEMVRAGAWYLERAADSIEEMVVDRNWEELMKEKPKMMLGLFGIAHQ